MLGRVSEESANNARLTELLDRAEEENAALEFSAVAHAVEEMGLDEDRIEAVYQEAVRRGIGLADDWKRDEAPEGTYTPDMFAEARPTLCRSSCVTSRNRRSEEHTS